jgi:putative hydrolase of the HAD superfamily
VFKDYRDCIEHICQEIHHPFKQSQIELASQIRMKMLRDELFMLREHAIEIISQIKAKGLKTGLISNCPPDTPGFWKENPMAPLFDVVLFSSTEGVMKPDKRIYQRTVQRLGVQPQQCIYIADGGINGELLAAKELGMTPVLISGYGSNSNDPPLEEWHETRIYSLKELMAIIE